MKYYIHRFSLLISLLILSFFNTTANAKYDPSLEWHTQETKYFLFHYHDGLENTVIDFAKHAENIHSKVSKFFDWQPIKKTHVILSDHFDVSNGSATPLPNTTITIFLTPPSEINSLEDYIDWKYLVFEHEYVHIIHLDKAKDFPLDMRSILGRHWFFFPNTFLPKWIIEGIATYIETDKDAGTGRGQSSYFRALMRNEVNNGIRSLAKTNETQLDWPGRTNRYLYGVYFLNFLEQQYGKQSIQDFVTAYSQFPIPFFINTVFKKVYHKNLHTLWKEFEVYLHEEFDAELQAHPAPKISPQLNPKIEQQQLSYAGYESGYSKLLPDNDILFIQNNNLDVKSLEKYNPTTKKSTTFFQSEAIGSSFDVHSVNGILLPLVDWVNNTRLVTDLYTLDLKTGKKTRLTIDKRYIRAIWHPDGKQIIAVNNNAGQHQLHLLDNHGLLLKILWQNEKDVVIGAMDFSPSGSKIVASVFRPGVGWNLEEFELASERWTSLTQNHFIESQPVYANDGNSLLYTAEYSGIYNIFEMTLSDKSIKQVTDINSAAYFPTLNAKSNTLFFAKLTANGFNLHSQKRKPFETKFTYNLREYSIEAPKAISIDEEVSLENVTDYDSLKYMLPASWWPLVSLRADGDELAFGFVISHKDPIERHFYSLFFEYDVKNYSPMWNVNYIYDRLTPSFLLSNSQNNFYPSKTAFRQERNSSLTIDWPIRKVNNNWNIFTTFKRIGNRVYLQSDRNNALGTFYDDLINVGISRGSTSLTELAVTQHSGSLISLAYEINRFSAPFKPASKIILNAALFSPVYFTSVLELGGTAVSAGGQAGDLYLGGNYGTFYSGGVPGKRSYGLRGYGDDSFVGSNLQMAYVKFHVPLIYPQQTLMSPPIGISTIKFNSFFQTARVGSFHNINHEKWNSNIGAELNIRANFGYGRFPYNIKAGVVHGLNNSGELQSYVEIISLIN